MKKLIVLIGIWCMVPRVCACAPDAGDGCPAGNVGDRCRVIPGCGGGGGKTAAPGFCVAGSYAGSPNSCTPPSAAGCYVNGYVCTVSGFWSVFFDACCSATCTPDNSCAALTPVGSSCTDSCGNVYAGTKVVAACSPPSFQPCGFGCCSLSSGQFCVPSAAGSHCCNAGTINCNGSCCDTRTHSCNVVGGIQFCVLSCAPNCGCAATTNVGSTCADGCGGQCAGTKPACAPACGCASTTAVGSTCPDGCGGQCAGTQCVPNCACAATTPTGSTCSDGCSGTCAGTGPPPPGPCGAGKLCGTLKDAETNTIALVNIPVLLHNGSGQVMQQFNTDSAGHYQFNVPIGGNYYVEAIADRSQSVSGPHGFMHDSAQANFKMRSVPAKVQVSGKPGTFVLATLTAWTLPEPPTVAPGPGEITSISKVVELDGKANMKLPGGFVWYLTCWTMDANFHYIKGASSAVNGGAMILAQETHQEACQ